MFLTQGTPPSGFSPLEASLAPQTAAPAIPAQLADWKTKLHARSMGPGVTGQLGELWRTDPESACLCLSCHAPLAEPQPCDRAIVNTALQAEGVSVRPVTSASIGVSARRAANGRRRRCTVVTCLSPEAQRRSVVCHANAQRAAAGRGVAIKGNQVLMVFRNDFAVRLLAAEPAAGFEAPIRIYVYENADGTATVSYIPPSVVFAPYRHAEVQAVGRELDVIFKAVVDRGLAAR